MKIFNYLVKLKSLNRISPIQNFQHSQFKGQFDIEEFVELRSLLIINK